MVCQDVIRIRAKKYLSVLFPVILLAGFLCLVADEKKMQTVWGSTKADNFCEVHDKGLSYGTVSISQISSRELDILGIAQCYRSCEKVYLSLLLEREKDGSYTTYRMWDFADYNTASVAREIKIIVPKGKYRVRGYFAMEEYTGNESTNTVTGSIVVR